MLLTNKVAVLSSGSFEVEDLTSAVSWPSTAGAIASATGVRTLCAGECAMVNSEIRKLARLLDVLARVGRRVPPSGSDASRGFRCFKRRSWPIRRRAQPLDA